jgi:hypothetical protein
MRAMPTHARIIDGTVSAETRVREIFSTFCSRLAQLFLGMYVVLCTSGYFDPPLVTLIPLTLPSWLGEGVRGRRRGEGEGRERRVKGKESEGKGE